MPARGAAELLRLQREAGNAAVSGALQRQPADSKPTDSKAADSKPADGKRPDFTQDKVDLAKEGVIRRVVRGLKYGLKGGYQSKYGDKESFEQEKTSDQHPEHSAVVIVPDRKLGAGPVQVILHFHGFGFRGGDPYAGYAVSSGGGGSNKMAKGTTRDYDQEHWEQQVGAVDKERAAATTPGPAVVTILVQGRGKSDFGDVPTYDYIADVFSKVPELAGVTRYSLIQTAHSGGGYKLRTNIQDGGQAKTNDRAKLPAAKAGTAAPIPADMVVMFDAEAMLDIVKKDKDTGKEISRTPAVASWAKSHVRRLDKEIRAALAAGRPADAQAAIDATPKLRAYFAPGGNYDGAYQQANREIGALIDQIPEPYGNGESSAVTVADLFRFVAVTGTKVRHESVISKGTAGKAEDGAMADALRASSDPTSDRKQAIERDVKKAKTPAPQPAPQPAAPQPAAPQPAAPAKAPTPAAATQAPAPAAATQAPTPAAATRAPAPAAAAKVTAKGWKASGATSDYELTQAQRDDLAAHTPEQRAADVADLKGKQARLTELAKAEKAARKPKAKTVMPEADVKELAELRALQKKVFAASRALKQTDVEEVLKAAGHTVDGWYGDVQKGTFLNVNVRVHKHLAAALQRAEATLVADAEANPEKLDAVALGQKLGMSPRAADMRVPKLAVGGDSISMHTFGLAVDLNYAGNPYLGLNGRAATSVIARASSLVNNAPVDVKTYLGGAKEAYDKMTGASQALVTYLSFKDPKNLQALKDAIAAHTPAKGEPADEAGWVKQIEKDHKAITKSKDFRNHTSPEKGFMNFPESVVMALDGAGLKWGGTYDDTKDLMHFDLRSGEGAKIDAARRKDKAGT